MTGAPLSILNDRGSLPMAGYGPSVTRVSRTFLQPHTYGPLDGRGTKGERRGSKRTAGPHPEGCGPAVTCYWLAVSFQLWPPASFSRSAARASSDARAPEVSSDSEEYEPPPEAAGAAPVEVAPSASA